MGCSIRTTRLQVIKRNLLFHPAFPLLKFVAKLPPDAEAFSWIESHSTTKEEATKLTLIALSPGKLGGKSQQKDP